MRPIYIELIAAAVVVAASIMPSRITGRSFLYHFALLLRDLLVWLAALLPACAAVVETIPRRLAQEFRHEHGMLKPQADAVMPYDIGAETRRLRGRT